MSTNSLIYNASQKFPSNENQIYEHVFPWVLLETFPEVGITCPASSNLEANLSKANLSSGLFATVNSLAISDQSCSETPAWVPSGPVDLSLSVLLVCFKKALMSLQFETFHQACPIKVFSMAAPLNFSTGVNTNTNNVWLSCHCFAFLLRFDHLSAILSFCQRPSVSDMFENFLIITYMPLVYCYQEPLYYLLLCWDFTFTFPEYVFFSIFSTCTFPLFCKISFSSGFLYFALYLCKCWKYFFTT